MFVLEALLLGSLLVTGRKLVTGSRFKREDFGVAVSSPEDSGPETRPIRDLQISSASMTLALAGVLWRLPLLGFLSLSGVFVVFLPTFREALQALRERRVDTSVLDTFRLTVCTVMGYTLIAGLNALLYAWSKQLLLRSEHALSATLDSTFGVADPVGWIECNGVEIEVSSSDIRPGDILRLRGGDTVPADGCVLDGWATVRARLASGEAIDVQAGDMIAAGQRLERGTVTLRVEAVGIRLTSPHARLKTAATHQTPVGEIGTKMGERMAPLMLGAFALSMPLMGVNRAASFLTTSFGAQMSRLGPYTARQFIGLAARYGILIREPRALELACLVNTVIFDGRLFSNPDVRTRAAGLVEALRQRAWPVAEGLDRPFAAYVMADNEVEGNALVDQMGLDGYFAVPSVDGRAALVEGLKSTGRLVCYVAAQDRDIPALGAALVACTLRETGELEVTPAHIVLTDPSLRGLMGMFELSTIFADKQRYNLLAPITTDVIDISTTVFLHCGLAYSILLSYAGFLASLARSGVPRPIALTGDEAALSMRPGDRPALTQ